MLNERIIERDINLEHANVGVSIIEDKYLSVEFFPDNQTQESFESAEFSNIVVIDDILESKDFDLNFPKDCVTLEDVKYVKNTVCKRVNQ